MGVPPRLDSDSVNRVTRGTGAKIEHTADTLRPCRVGLQEKDGCRASKPRRSISLIIDDAVWTLLPSITLICINAALQGQGGRCVRSMLHRAYANRSRLMLQGCGGGRGD